MDNNNINIIDILLKKNIINTDLLCFLTKTDYDNLQVIINKIPTNEPQKKIKHYLFDLASVLLTFNDIDEDKRIVGIVEVFNQIYNVSNAELANILGISKSFIDDFMSDSSIINADEKYIFSVRIMLLYYMLKFPDYEMLP